MKFTFFILILFLSHGHLFSQNTNDLGIEFQAYPTGLIPGIHFETQIGEKSTISVRLGLNIFDHRDLGVHDEETGNGFGFTFGYHRYFQENLKRWKLGIKLDYWNNDVDWVDNEINGRIEGSSEITVLQPTVELGYVVINRNAVFLTPTIAFGVEWNVETTGEPTGEGPIFLVGVIAGKRF